MRPEAHWHAAGSQPRYMQRTHNGKVRTSSRKTCGHHVTSQWLSKPWKEDHNTSHVSRTINGAARAPEMSVSVNLERSALGMGSSSAASNARKAFTLSAIASSGANTHAFSSFTFCASKGATRIRQPHQHLCHGPVNWPQLAAKEACVCCMRLLPTVAHRHGSIQLVLMQVLG